MQVVLFKGPTVESRKFSLRVFEQRLQNEFLCEVSTLPFDKNKNYLTLSRNFKILNSNEAPKLFFFVYSSF